MKINPSKFQIASKQSLINHRILVCRSLSDNLLWLLSECLYSYYYYYFFVVEHFAFVQNDLCQISPRTCPPASNISIRWQHCHQQMNDSSDFYIKSMHLIRSNQLTVATFRLPEERTRLPHADCYTDKQMHCTRLPLYRCCIRIEYSRVTMTTRVPLKLTATATKNMPCAKMQATR